MIFTADKKYFKKKSFDVETSLKPKVEARS